jgi:hypothetical protein
MKINAQDLMFFLKRFQFTKRIEEIVIEEKDEQMYILANDNDLIVFGMYEEFWSQEEPLGLNINSICNYLKGQDEVDITFTDRIIIKGKGTLEYKAISPRWVSTRPEMEIDPFKMVSMFDKRCYIDKETKGIIQNLLATTQASSVKFDSVGIHAGTDNEHMISYEIETGLDEGIEMRVNKETLVNVLKKSQELNIKFSDSVTDAIMVTTDDVFYAIKTVVE